MARSRPATRLTEVLDAAADVFMRNGYRGARVDQIAELAGVAPGTIYLLAASKEALFDLVIRREFGAPMLTDDAPYEVLRPAALVDQLWDHLQSVALFPALDSALATDHTSNATAELQVVVAELYRWIATYWRGLRIAERCATEWPELSLLFYQQLRRPGLARLGLLLERRIAAGHLRRPPDVALAARVILEMVAFFAMHRHTAPDSADVDAAAAEQTVIHMATAAFTL